MKFILAVGVVLFLGSIVLIYNNYEKLQVQKRGHIVKMKIERIPSFCYGTKSRYFVKYSYGGEIYDKSIKGSYCQDHYLGEIVEMKIMKGSTVILFPHESIIFSLISFAVIGIFGLIIFIVYLKKIRN